MQGNVIVAAFFHLLIHFLVHRLDKEERKVARVVDLHAAKASP